MALLNLQMHFDVSFDELYSFAQTFWNKVGDSKVFAFHGVMGAGKTTIITYLCRLKGVTENLSSPTFSIINEYTLENEKDNKTIYHIDLYRLESYQEVLQTGVEECLESGSICMVEWPEKAPWLFDDKAVHVFIKTTGDTVRHIEIGEL